MTEEIDLRIRIPERFKESSLKRFNAHKAKRRGQYFIKGKRFTIKVECALCVAYREHDEESQCTKCPFFIKFHEIFGDNNCICLDWMNTALNREGIRVWKFHPYSSEVRWVLKNNKEARQQLKVLLQKIKEFVIWV